MSGGSTTAIVLAAAVWGAKWRGKTVLALCDNAAVVSIVNQGASRNPEAMHLMHCLAFLAAKFEFFLFSTHLRGVDNSLADSLSRNNRDHFLAAFPQANPVPTPLSAELLDLLILSKPDWNAKRWTELWTTIFNMV